MDLETFHGYVASIKDAILLFEACRQGILKRVQRRPSEAEKKDCVKSGAIFILDEKESRVRRWTDSRKWSPVKKLFPCVLLHLFFFLNLFLFILISL